MAKAIMLSASPASLMRGMENFILSGVLPQVRSVKWEPDAHPHTTGTCIVLPTPFIGMTDVDLALWRYKAQHEIGHESAVNSSPHWKDVMTEKRKTHKDKLLWNIANLLSDHTQERNCLGEWFGRDEIILRGRELFLKREVMPKIDKTSQFSQLFLYDTIQRKEWNSFITMPNPSLCDMAFFGKVAKCGDWTKMRNEAQVFDMALRLRELFDEPESSEEESDGEGGGSGSGSGDGEGKGKPKKSKKDASGESKDEAAARIILVAKHSNKKPSKADPDFFDPCPHTFMDDGTRNTCSGSKRISVRHPIGLDGKKIK